jgi:hypothetical protein
MKAPGNQAKLFGRFTVYPLLDLSRNGQVKQVAAETVWPVMLEVLLQGQKMFADP